MHVQQPKKIFSTPPLFALYKLIGITGWSMAVVISLSHYIPAPTNVQEMQTIHLIKSAIMTCIVFICTSLYYIFYIEKKSLSIFFQWQRTYYVPILLVIGLILCSIFIESLILHGNINFLPNWLGTFKIWINNKETVQSALEKKLITFTDVLPFLYGVGVVALLPAVGEELFFRGLLQNLLFQITQNHHKAISITAFIFSIVHYRPYHFIIIFIMGVLFGYIYYLTRDLLFVMIGHFINNFLVLTNHFLNFTMSVEKIIKMLSPITLLLSFLSVFLIILLLLYRLQYYNKQ